MANNLIPVKLIKKGDQFKLGIHIFCADSDYTNGTIKMSSSDGPEVKSVAIADPEKKVEIKIL